MHISGIFLKHNIDHYFTSGKRGRPTETIVAFIKMVLELEQDPNKKDTVYHDFKLLMVNYSNTVDVKDEYDPEDDLTKLTHHQIKTIAYSILDTMPPSFNMLEYLRPFIYHLIQTRDELFDDIYEIYHQYEEKIQYLDTII